VKSRLFTAAAISPHTHRLSLLHGAGSLAVDAALTSLVRGKVLVVINGVYGERLVATLSPLEGTKAITHAPGVGTPPSLDELKALIEHERPGWLALVHHETTTGLLNPLGEIIALARSLDCRTFVDSVSSMGAHTIDPNVDVIAFNSNKCLESLPGVAGVFWAADLELHPTVPVLDVGAYANELPSTPNVQAVVALDVALDLLLAEDRPARYARLARKVWEAGGRRFEPLLPERDRSNVLTSFRLNGRDPDELHGRALEHGYVIYHGQRQLRDEIFRVANMGAGIDERVIEDLFAVLA
jgi:2-aminoethylphosphonate-pyruvate transaminase